MKERPIPFTPEMVRAILEGRKTMTRRVVKPQPWTSTIEYLQCGEQGASHGYDPVKWYPCDSPIGNGGRYPCDEGVTCPYGVPGDRLWVKEGFRAMSDLSVLGVKLGCSPEEVVAYKADGKQSVLPWKSSRFMPRWASRILLEIVSVRVERVQDISEEDARAEGVPPGCYFAVDGATATGQHRRMFEETWDHIYRKKPEKQWNANPWVWVIEFKVVS